ncbi:unnamed protein product [Ixodes pacificus]
MSNTKRKHTNILDLASISIPRASSREFGTRARA